MEKDDCEDEEEEEDEDEYGGLCSPSLEESGLGLLARFAASALPSPIIPAPLSVVQLEAKQKARKKEERQSLLGNCGRSIRMMFHLSHSSVLYSEE